MQVHVSPTIPDGDLPVRMNPGSGDPFALIAFGDAELVIESDADAERVIKAAALSIAMRKMIGTPHPFESSAYPGAVHGNCTVCGLLRSWEDHAAPAERPVHRLACGCTDPRCDCPRCQAGTPHEPGTPWHCDEHGKTTVAEPAQEHAYVTPAMAERRDKAAAEYADRHADGGVLIGPMSDAGCYDITGRTA